MNSATFLYSLAGHRLCLFILATCLTLILPCGVRAQGIGRLAVKAITSVPLKQEGTSRGYAVRRPLYFVFSVGGRTFAASQNVTLRRGRRYPEVEHWFVRPQSRQHLELNELQQASAAPA